MRVLHCVPYSTDGGVGVLTDHLLRSETGAGASHLVLSTQPTRPHAAPELAGDASLIELPHASSVLSLGRVRAALRAARRFRPHVIRGASLEGVVIASVLGAALRVPVIYEQHGGGEDEVLKARLAAAASAHLATCCVSVAPEVDDYVRRRLHVRASKRLVIPNAVDAPAPPPADRLARRRVELGLDRSALVVGTVGRLFDHIKRVSDLIRAVGLASARVPDVRLLVVGEGPDRQALERLAAELAPGRVVFTGRTSTPGDFYALMHVFALASVTEGSPLTIIEAMRAGLPVVATAVGGIPSLVDHGRTGLLVPPRDPSAIADAIVRLSTDPQTRVELGERGRERADAAHSVERYRRDVERLVDSLVVGGRRWRARYLRGVEER